MEKTASRKTKGLQIPLKLLALVLIAGAGSMVLEIAGSKLLSIYFGNTIYLWAAQIAIVLGALSVGYWYGGNVADGENPSDKFYPLLLASGIWIAIVPVLVVIVVVLAIGLGSIYGPILASFLLFAFPVFVLAMVTPIAIQAACQNNTYLGRMAGLLYAYSTMASIAGTLLAGFVLIPSFGLKAIFAITGIVYVVLALLNLPKSRYFMIGALVMLLVLLFPLKAAGTIYEADSAYYHITVMDINQTRYLLLDSDSHSAEYLNSSGFVFNYIKILAQTRNLRSPSENILFGGLGSGSLPKYFLKDGRSQIDAVEIDPKVIETAVKWFGFPENDSKLRVFNEDLRQFLRRNEKKYDLIVLDAYGSHYSVPSHLLTEEFFTTVSDHLNTNGLLAINLISPPSGGLAPSVRATLSKEFGSVWTYCTSNSSENQNTVILAWNGEWAAPDNISGFEACSKSAEDAPVFTDDWAPTDYIIAKGLK